MKFNVKIKLLSPSLFLTKKLFPTRSVTIYKFDALNLEYRNVISLIRILQNSYLPVGKYGDE